MKKLSVASMVLLCAASLMAEGNSWSVSVGAGIRTGMKVEGQGGAFDVKTGHIGADLGGGFTTDWSVNDTATQFYVADTTHMDGPWDLDYMEIMTSDGSKDATARMTSLEVGIARELMVDDAFALGVRFTLGGAFGLNKSLSATSTTRTYAFDHFVDMTVADPVPGVDHVSVTPGTIVPGDSTSMKVKGSLWKVGLGPEFSFLDDSTNIGVTLHPFASLNVASMKVDGEHRYGNGNPTKNISASENKLLFGGGVTAALTYDITKNWTAGVSVGYEYLPKMDISDGAIGAEVALSALTFGASATWRF